MEWSRRFSGRPSAKQNVKRFAIGSIVTYAMGARNLSARLICFECAIFAVCPLHQPRRRITQNTYTNGWKNGAIVDLVATTEQVKWEEFSLFVALFFKYCISQKR